MASQKNYICKYLIVILLSLLGLNIATAQTPVTIGTGTGTTTSYPIYPLFNYSATESIYTGTEIGSAGTITKLAYQKTSGSSTTAPAIKIYMKTTALTAVTTGTSTYTIGTTGFAGYTLVYDGTLTNNGTNAWMEVTLNTPFAFTDISTNLSVLVVCSTYISSGRPNYTYTTQTAGRKTGYYYNDSTMWSSSSSMAPVLERPNIRLTLTPPATTGCVTPGSFTAANVTAGSTSLSWVAPATGTAPQGYEWEVRTAGTAGSGATNRTAQGNTATALNATLTGLEGNTTYTAYVRTKCGTDTYSSWVSTTFTTLCGAVNVPYTQTFEAISACPLIQDVNNDGKTWVISTAAANSGSNGLRYTYSGSNAANDWWISPGINVTAGATYQVTFTYRGYSSSSPEALEVKTGTSQNAAGMTGTTLFSNTNIINTTYTSTTINYTATATGVQYFGWHAISAANRYYIDIDNIAITLLPNCSASTFPQNVVAQASKTSICSDENLTFSLSTAMPLATGITYQWKSSADGITYTNTGTASASATATLTASANARWFKCDVLCNGSVQFTSAPVAIALQVTVLSTTPGSGCANTPIPLQATTQSGNTLKWYADPSGGTALGTGTTFNSPAITTSATYYVAATGVLNNYTAGPASPASLSASSYGGSSNGGESMIFSMAEAMSLTSVTIYPADPQPDNIIYLRDSNNNIINQLTFSTVGTSPVSGASTVGAPYVVNLNWDIPAGSGYKLEWGVPIYYGSHRLLRNASGATALYGVNNNGITFTGNSSAYGNGYWFYFYDWKFKKGCGESAVRVPVTATVKAEWTGNAGSNWNTPENWCGNALPTMATDVVIPQTAHNPIIPTGIALANNLTLQQGATLTVHAGATLNVENTLTTTGATLTVQNNAALLQGGNITSNNNIGNIEVIKNSNALYRLDYTLWSAPVSGQQLLAFSPQTSPTRFYEYKYAHDTATNSNAEQYFIADNTADFTPAKGYLIRMPNGDTAPGYNSGANPLTFVGTFNGRPNNGTISYPLSTQGNRYTAVGNPYPSPISVTAFFAQNAGKLDASSALYFWRKRNNAGATSYATLNAIAYTANQATGGGTDQAAFYNGLPTENWIIAAGQGFIVRTATTPVGTELTFTNTMRKAATQTQAFFRHAANGLSRFWLNLTNNDSGFSQIAVAYKDDATTGIDYGYDSEQLNDDNNLLLYSVAANTHLAIQARPAFTVNDEVTVGFTAVAAGQYTISLHQFDGLFTNNQDIFIKDNLLNTFTNLKQQDYSFTSNPGTFNGRFSIVYTAEALGTDTHENITADVTIYKERQQVNITATSAINSINVHDIRGRKLYSASKVNAFQAIINSLTTQHEVLIVTVNTTKGTVIKRIVF